MSTETQKLLQEVFILATGKGANASAIQALEGLQDNGNWQPLVDAINAYMSGQAAVYGHTATIQQLALQGLNLALDDTTAGSIAQLVSSGQMSWADIFIWSINNADAGGKTLDNRAEAANEFMTKLGVAGKSSLQTGAAVDNAVKNLLQSIGSDGNSLASGKAGLDALVTGLSVQGIRSVVVDGYVKDATVFADANGDGVQNDGEWSATTDEGGNYVLPADTVGAKIVAFGGTDILTGKDFKGALTATLGSTVVNPITTLIASLTDSGQSVSEAIATLQTGLGLPTSVSLLSYDPLAVLADGNASDSAKVAALGFQKTALQVSNVIAQTAAAIQSGATCCLVCPG